MTSIFKRLLPERRPAREMPGRCPVCGRRIEFVLLPLENDREIMLCTNHETMMRFDSITRKPLGITWAKARVVDDNHPVDQVNDGDTFRDDDNDKR
jgi:hypothetical protein